MSISTWDHIDLGPTPTMEACVQAPYGSQEKSQAAYAECRRFADQLKREFPPVPGTKIQVKSNPYGEFIYYSVIVKFNALDDAAVQYAFYLESNLPYHWEKDDDATD